MNTTAWIVLCTLTMHSGHVRVVQMDSIAQCISAKGYAKKVKDVAYNAFPADALDMWCGKDHKSCQLK